MSKFPRAMRLIVSLLSIAIAFPVGFVMISLVLYPHAWQEYYASPQLGQLAIDSLILGVLVGIASGALGASLSWLTTHFQFPGRDFLSWGLFLPLSIPAYVSGFVLIGVWDYSGPVQTQCRNLMDECSFFPSVRSLGGLVIAMSLSLFPYVYAIARSGFLVQGHRLAEAARLLDGRPLRYFLRVALPTNLPWVVAGMSLVFLEAVADFGTVSIFNYDTFTTAIYTAWYGFFSLETALQLASFLVILVAVCWGSVRGWVAVRERRLNMSAPGQLTTRRLSGWSRWIATLFTWAVFVMSFVVPIFTMAAWSLRLDWQMESEAFLSLATNTVLIGALVGAICLVLAVVLNGVAYVDPHPWNRSCGMLASLGYAVPGAVLAIGIYVSLLEVSKLFSFSQGWLTTSILCLTFGGVTRFLAVSSQPVQASLGQVSRSLHDAAQTLGHGHVSFARRVMLPLARPGILTAFVLVFTDMAKEMPITLMTRPFGWDTLSVRIYEMTSEGEWERASLAALCIVAIGLVPTLLLSRQMAKRWSS